LLLAGGLAAGLVLGFGSGASHAKLGLTARNNTLVRIDPSSNKVVAQTAVGVPTQELPGAGDVAVGGDTVWVYNWNDHDVQAVDPKTNVVERSVPMAGFATSLHWNSIAADTGGAWALEFEGETGVLTRITTGYPYPRKMILRYLPLAVAAGNNAVWVAAKTATQNVILRIDPRTGSVLHTEHLRGGDVESIAVGDGAVWALQSGTISRLDPRTGRVTRRLHFPGWNVFQIAAGDTGVWATMQLPSGNVLMHVDTRPGHAWKPIPEPLASSTTIGTRLAVGDGAVWWNNTSGTIWRVDPRTDEIVRSIRVTRPAVFSGDVAPQGIATGPGSVWVTVTIGS
jgi:DNA-binding beta-propeller fold protein YncE